MTLQRYCKKSCTIYVLQCVTTPEELDNFNFVLSFFSQIFGALIFKVLVPLLTQVRLYSPFIAHSLYLLSTFYYKALQALNLESFFYLNPFEKHISLFFLYTKIQQHWRFWQKLDKSGQEMDTFGQEMNTFGQKWIHLDKQLIHYNYNLPELGPKNCLGHVLWYFSISLASKTINPFCPGLWSLWVVKLSASQVQ